MEGGVASPGGWRVFRIEDADGCFQMVDIHRQGAISLSSWSRYFTSSARLATKPVRVLGCSAFVRAFIWRARYVARMTEYVWPPPDAERQLELAREAIARSLALLRPAPEPWPTFPVRRIASNDNSP